MISNIESSFSIQSKRRGIGEILYGMNDSVLSIEYQHTIPVTTVLTHKGVAFCIDRYSGRSHHLTMPILHQVSAFSREHLYTVGAIADNVQLTQVVKR